jgi:putative ABC transport system permease protein
MSELLNSWLGIINSILVIILAVAVANTMLITISERQREIGTLKAVGITSRHIRELVLLETLTITVLAFIIGCIIGVSLTAASDYFFWNSDQSGGTLGLFIAPTRLTINTLIGAAGISIIVGTLAALLPAVRAASLQPAEALRYE